MDPNSISDAKVVSKPDKDFLFGIAAFCMIIGSVVGLVAMVIFLLLKVGIIGAVVFVVGVLFGAAYGALWIAGSGHVGQALKEMFE